MKHAGWVVPSMITGSFTCGRGEAGVIVWTPPGRMWNTMVSRVPVLALAAVMASRRVHSELVHPPVPGSAVEFTLNVAAAWADGAGDRMTAVAATITARVATRRLLDTSTPLLHWTGYPRALEKGTPRRGGPLRDS